jgi:predicted GH43/DUF377 family glycosyl hydrolase
MIRRFDCNPLITPADVQPSRDDMEVLCAFNAGATTCDGKTLLLVRVAERPIPEDGYVSTAYLDPDNPGSYKVLRVKLDDPDLDFGDPRAFEYKGALYLTSISHLRLAVSDDGRRFTVADKPTFLPEVAEEVYGVEDPRIAKIDDCYAINYSAISLRGVCTMLARTQDFETFERLGVMFPPDNKDIALFPERIGGRYYTFHRPSMKQIGMPSMWLASSDNLRDWGRHRYIMGPRAGKWDSERVGCGAEPVKTDQGWLQFYHGSDHNVRYCTGAVLLDLDEPWKVLKRCDTPLLEPEVPYEREGLVPNVIFHNGLVDRGNGRVDLYYGAADTVTCGARVDIGAVLEWLGA